MSGTLKAQLIRIALDLPETHPAKKEILHMLSLQKHALRLESTPTIVGVLNELLRRELTVVNQYMVQYAICDNLGYKSLAGFFKGLALAEMKHAELLIERIVFLEGSPEVGQLNEVQIGSGAEEHLRNDWQAEREAVDMYNRAIALCYKLGDNGTRKMLEPILAEEEQHLDSAQAMINQIKTIGLENFLAEKVE